MRRLLEVLSKLGEDGRQLPQSVADSLEDG
jgi:hypothetical protein